jgi:hypothetical protein
MQLVFQPERQVKDGPKAGRFRRAPVTMPPQSAADFVLRSDGVCRLNPQGGEANCAARRNTRDRAMCGLKAMNTVMERPKIPLHKWAMAFYLMCSSKRGMSAHQHHPPRRYALWAGNVSASLPSPIVDPFS